ncbi:YaiO family outer membrane beta-barrel protein [Henriciella litoralis]|uniref:YaiO family outer membrane beta-barrel protein n=1 Tax=Henriciella litoralis TaxID=568102 RepID=UPI00146D0A03|nr:YaiO family outer membrane beta-barrel protein [Henriciella litoralis]
MAALWGKQVFIASALLGYAAAAPFAVAEEKSRIDQATEARLDGRFDDAEALLLAETSEYPENADAWLQLGLAHSAQGDFDEAREALNRTLQIAPDYTDADLALARLDWYEGRNNAALNRLSGMVETPDTIALRQRIETAEQTDQTSAWRLDLAVGRSTLTQSLPDWTELSGAATYQTGSGQSYTLLVDYADRFNTSDVYLEGRAGSRLSPRFTGYLAAGGAPDAIFRPEWAVSTGLTALIGDITDPTDALRASADFRYAQYPAGVVQSGKFGVAKPFASDTFRLGGSLILLSDEQGDTRRGYVLQGEWQAAPASRILLTYADAPETSDGITLDVKSAVLAWRQSVSDRQSFQINLVHETRSAYDRTGIVVSTSVTF